MSSKIRVPFYVVLKYRLGMRAAICRRSIGASSGFGYHGGRAYPRLGPLPYAPLLRLAPWVQGLWYLHILHPDVLLVPEHALRSW